MTTWYRNNPQARMYVRAMAVAVAVYVCKVFQSGVEAFELAPFVWGLGSAAAYLVIGFLTPMEPMVGAKAKVEVPADGVAKVTTS
jgi:hypothetical protein